MVLGVPCMTLRENTERPVTITEGTNRLVRLTTEDILNNYRRIVRARDKNEGWRIPRLQDGRAAEIIATIATGQACRLNGVPASSELR